MMVAIVGEYIQQETSVVKRKIAIKKNTDSHKRRVIQIRVGIRHTKSFIQKGLPGMRARQGLRRSKLPLAEPRFETGRYWKTLIRHGRLYNYRVIDSVGVCVPAFGRSGIGEHSTQRHSGRNGRNFDNNKYACTR